MNQQVTESLNTVELASRWSRLWAAIIDGLLALATTIPLLIFLGFAQIWTEQSISISTTLQIIILNWAVFLLMHGYLLKTRGQTIGKSLIGIRIVTTENHHPDFLNLLLKRYLPLNVVGYIPVVGPYLTLAEVLFIFRSDKRCLHDLIAGTKVINATPMKEN